MQKEIKLALAMIVKGDDEEAKALETCLHHVSPGVDKIFITITHKAGENRNAEVERVANSYNAVISDFEWINDFAAARNFNFEQVPKEFDYILWCDADDAIRDVENLKPIIAEHQEVDIFVLNYLYAFDEYRNPIVVHQKEQIIKNDGCCKWVGAIHEHLHAQRKISQYLIEGIERLHLSITDDRVKISQIRNLEIAEAEIKRNPDEIRNYYILGNALYAVGRLHEALEAYGHFMKYSNSDEEKYIVKLRRAETYWFLDQKEEAITEAQNAIGFKPNYPDAYHLLGTFYYETQRYAQAAEQYLYGLVKKPPIYSIIVYNPREYDYVPLMKLAKTYFALSRPDLALPLLEGCEQIYPKDENIKRLILMIKPEVKKMDEVLKYIAPLQGLSRELFEAKYEMPEKEYKKKLEKLKKGLDKIPFEFQDHPAVCNLRNVNFVKTASSGRDLIIYCGYTTEEWTPETAKKKGIGGSEEAVIWLANLLAEKGWKVTVYNNCGHKDTKYGKVLYRPFWSWNYRDKQDVIVLWRSPKPLDYDLNADKVILDLHDVLPPEELTPIRVARVDKIFVKSKFHREIFPAVVDAKFEVIPNGIDPTAFEATVERDQNLIINTSSSDRSLATLLELFGEVKKQVPTAKLKWAYGWETFDAAHKDNAKMMAWKEEMKAKIAATEGFEELGRINHTDIAKLNLQANVFGYPTEFAEIFCISAVKAQAAGAIPVTTDFAALNETVKFGFKVHSELTKDNWADRKFEFSLKGEAKKKEWVDAVVKLLKNPPSEEIRKEMRDWAKANFSWYSVAEKWNELIETKNA